MMSPEDKLFCRLDQKPGVDLEQRRLRTLEESGLLEAESVPVFEEATQTAAHFLDAPICILGLLDQDRQWFKSAVGLSRIGLMNSLASSRQLPRSEAFGTHVVESQQVLAIPDTIANSTFADSVLVHRYGIRSYLGVPLLMADGQCIGSLEVMGLAPRSFSDKEMAFLELMARWSMSEFERSRLLKRQERSQSAQSVPHRADTVSAIDRSTSSTRVKLISQMTQELCTPLTSILGMARVLSQGIYGNLTEKQKEYIEIVHNSGQYLLSLVNEIVELGALNDSNTELNLAPVDIEMLCQQAISTLSQAAQRRDQQIQLTVEPGHRIWLLDKDKVRHMLYHLVFSVIQASSSESIIRIHVSRKQNFLHLTIWTSHPWLGEGLPQVELAANRTNQLAAISSATGWGDRTSFSTWEGESAECGLDTDNATNAGSSSRSQHSRESLGLMLSRQLAEMHEGNILVQGSVEEGYRYVIRLPHLRSGTDKT